MSQRLSLHDVVDLTHPERNVIFNMSLGQARERLLARNANAVREIDGHFAVVAREGTRVRMARTLAIPMRYFLAKRSDGPVLVVACRIDEIAQWLRREGLAEQFHPSYTRMVPAHYITEITLVGCPDPSPTYTRYFDPPRNTLPPSLDEIGRLYVGAMADEIAKWLRTIPADAPVGVCFSGGIDSGAVFLVTHHVIQTMGMNPARLKAFTLSVCDCGPDLAQARSFLEQTGLQLFHEPIEADHDELDYQEAIRVIEDYKPLDVQAATALLGLCRGIRQRYPEWRYLLDGDGGDENLKDYPIHENPELTIRSVLNNRMLYHEGWGVEALKHSLVYSGGLSRGSARGFAPATRYGFDKFSPFMSPSAIEIAEGIPFIELTGWEEQRLYRLKEEVVAGGVKTITGVEMPRFTKRRFQNGAVPPASFARLFPERPQTYRHAFHALYGN